jgi:hypothetical protein
MPSACSALLRMKQSCLATAISGVRIIRPHLRAEHAAGANASGVASGREAMAPTIAAGVALAGRPRLTAASDSNRAADFTSRAWRSRSASASRCSYQSLTIFGHPN